LKRTINKREILKQKLEIKENEVKIVKEELNEVKNQLLVSYHNYLINGKDTR